jgi:hypothetical protein
LEEVALHTGHEVLVVDDLYFTDCWWSTRDFRPAAQALPNPIINLLISFSPFESKNKQLTMRLII